MLDLFTGHSTWTLVECTMDVIYRRWKVGVCNSATDGAVKVIVENYYSSETVEHKIMFTLCNDEVSKKLSNCHKV